MAASELIKRCVGKRMFVNNSLNYFHLVFIDERTNSGIFVNHYDNRYTIFDLNDITSFCVFAEDVEGDSIIDIHRQKLIEQKIFNFKK